ncbi:putative codeine 3-O-demethylase [Helianthus annuus]|nr:putative codeine 3-O-demethylase [Helianthus annuus]KAJ0618111.1 putative codeine 3-O-demethylase [Helianthus annuus]KAJ0951015.1 putative codeine 3-O-demethylase [Helianthus annuus]
MESKGGRFGASLLVPSVQELANEHLIKVPSRYIRDDQESVIPSSMPQVPIIDMDRLTSEDSIDSELENLHLACKDWGFFQIINHGISGSLLEKVKKETQEFFKLPIEVKKKFWQTSEDVEGFGQAFVVSEEQKLDWADMFFLVTLPPHSRRPRLFPNLPLPFRDILDEYSREIMNTAKKTLLYIAKALKMETKDLMVLFEEGMQSMRMNYYPPCPQPEQVIGLTPHSDAVGITFLLELNEVHGLQIRKDGIWIPIIPLPNSFIVNIGEILEIVTNGQYKSVEHRATVNSERERLSIATFINPKDGEIGPAPSIVTPETPPKFTRVTTSDFFKNLFSKELKRKSNLEQYYI